MSDHWPQSALTNDVLVANLLLQIKHSPDSDSLLLPPPPPPTTSPTTTSSFTHILPPRWGNRKNRSKSVGKEHRGSPTTHLSWSGGSASDESSRPSDLSSGCRSVKVNESASTSSWNKFDKRKSFVEFKDEETPYGRIHTNRELTSMRVTSNQLIPDACDSLKKIKIDSDPNQRNKTRVVYPSLVTQSCRVEAETKGPQRGFVLPDLNMAPDEEDLVMMMS